MLLAPALALAVFIAPPCTDSTELRGEDLMKALRGGGYTILLRHARTDYSYKEDVASVPAERSKQRNLSADGVRDAALMGVVLRKYQIPIGEIIASPMFRTRETAEFAAGAPTVSMALRTFPPDEEQAALLAVTPKPGTNRLLVTHHFVIEKWVPGIKPGDVGESEAAVVRPTPDGHVELVGRITIADWERLAGVPERPATSAPTPPPTTPAPTTSTSSVSPVAIPETPVGQLARRYVDAFNSGDSTRMREFIESSLVPNPERPTAVRLQTFASSFRDMGPLTVLGVRESSSDSVALDIRARERDLVLTVRRSPDHAGRAASITIATFQGAHP